MILHFWTKDHTHTRAIASQTEGQVITLGEWNKATGWTLVRGAQLVAGSTLKVLVNWGQGWRETTAQLHDLRWTIDNLAVVALEWSRHGGTLDFHREKRTRSALPRWTDQPEEALAADLYQELRTFLANCYPDLAAWWAAGGGDLYTQFWAPAFPLVRPFLVEGRELDQVPELLEPALRCADWKQAAHMTALTGRKTLSLLTRGITNWKPSEINLFHWSWAAALAPILPLDLRQEILALVDHPRDPSTVYGYRVAHRPCPNEGFLAWLGARSGPRVVLNLFLEFAEAPDSQAGTWWRDLENLYGLLVDAGEAPVRPERHSLQGWHDVLLAQSLKLTPQLTVDSFEYHERYQALDGLNLAPFSLHLPETSQDLEEAGRRLSNCVGSYTRRILQGESLVVLIRKAGELYACLEVTEGKVAQLLGQGNSALPKVEDQLIRAGLSAMPGILS